MSRAFQVFGKIGVIQCHSMSSPASVKSSLSRVSMCKCLDLEHWILFEC